jgi:hypothetical protein
MDYLRWRTRPTEADQVVRARLANLIIGEHGDVRRMVERPPGADPLGALPAPDRAVAGSERGPHGDLTA